MRGAAGAIDWTAFDAAADPRQTRTSSAEPGFASTQYLYHASLHGFQCAMYSASHLDLAAGRD